MINNLKIHSSPIVGYKITYQDGSTENLTLEQTKYIDNSGYVFLMRLYERVNSNNSKATLVEPLSRLFNGNPVSQQYSNLNIIPNYDTEYSTLIISWGYAINGIVSTNVAETPDMAMILALEENYLGKKQTLSSYIAKLFNIITTWSI